MQERIMDAFLHRKMVRLIVTMMIAAIPIGVCTAWTGSAYLNFFWNMDFGMTMLKLWVFAGPPAVIVALILSYAIEWWVIRDRANESWLWVLVRMVLYLSAGLPIGATVLIGIRWGIQQFPQLVESVYFVQSYAMAFVMGILFTLVERAVAEVQRREAQLNNQIRELRIEIDVIKRQRQVSEIVESDFFQVLQAKANDIRRRSALKSMGAGSST